jgi:DNA mismatch repair ATPase MutS
MEQIASDRVLKNLDFGYVLDRILPVTPYGREIKKNMKPFVKGQEEKLMEHLDRLEAVLELIRDNRLTFIEVRTIMQDIKDLRQSIHRAGKGINLNMVELFEIKALLFQIKSIFEKLEPFASLLPREFLLTPLTYLERLLDPEGVGVKSFYIYDSYSDRLKEIRQKKQALENQFSGRQKELVIKAQEDLGLNFRPNGEITISKNQKELLETVKNYPGLVYLSESYINITFRVKPTPEMDDLKRQLEDLRAMEQEEEENIRARLTGEIAGFREELLDNIETIGKLDYYIALAYFAREIRGVKPGITSGDAIDIRNGRHPLVEERLREHGEKFQPVSIRAEKGVTVITGANMGGKSVALKMVGLLTLMAQYGLFVPADEMSTELRDFVYVSMGDTQSVETGLSTFGAEVFDMIEALEKSSRHGLILIDELARGTNPREGHAICAAIVKYLVNKNSICIITTHFDGIGSLEGVVHLQVGGLNGADTEELRRTIAENPHRGVEIIRKYMDYNLYPADRKALVPRDAIKVAALMGLDEDILEMARQMLE